MSSLRDNFITEVISAIYNHRIYIDFPVGISYAAARTGIIVTFRNWLNHAYSPNNFIRAFSYISV